MPIVNESDLSRALRAAGQTYQDYKGIQREKERHEAGMEREALAQEREALALERAKSESERIQKQREASREYDLSRFRKQERQRFRDLNESLKGLESLGPRGGLGGMAQGAARDAIGGAAQAFTEGELAGMRGAMEGMDERGRQLLLQDMQQEGQKRVLGRKAGETRRLVRLFMQPPHGRNPVITEEQSQVWLGILDNEPRPEQIDQIMGDLQTASGLRSKQDYEVDAWTMSDQKVRGAVEGMPNQEAALKEWSALTTDWFTMTESERNSAKKHIFKTAGQDAEKGNAIEAVRAKARERQERREESQQDYIDSMLRSRSPIAGPLTPEEVEAIVERAGEFAEATVPPSSEEMQLLEMRQREARREAAEWAKKDPEGAAAYEQFRKATGETMRGAEGKPAPEAKKPGKKGGGTKGMLEEVDALLGGG